MYLIDKIDQEKLIPYLIQVEKEQQEKNRIKQLTEQLMSKTSLKLKLQTKESKREEQFNKKLKDMKQLNTFIDAQERISKLNLLNNRALILKLNAIKKTKLISSQKNIDILQNTDQIADDKMILPKKQIQIKNIMTQRSNYDQYEEDDILNLSKTPKNDAKQFYRSVFKTTPSPFKQKEYNQYEKQTKIAKKYLQSQGLLEHEFKTHKKRISICKVPIEDYYKKFQQQCNQIVKEVTQQSRRKSIANQINEKDKLTQKGIIRMVKSTQIHQKQSYSPTNHSNSPNYQQRMKKSCQLNSGNKSQRNNLKTSSDLESDRTPLKINLRTQFETFSQGVNQVQQSFAKINRHNNQLMRRMSSIFYDIENTENRQVKSNRQTKTFSNYLSQQQLQ